MLRPPYNENTFYHWTEINVRFRDLDPLNHVNNAIFNTYFEESRIRFLADVFRMQQEMEKGKTFVLVKATVEYLQQITYPSTLLIGTGVGRVGNSSIEAIQAIYNKESKELLAAGETVGVWYDLKKQRPTRLPELSNLDELKVKMDD